MDDIAVVGLGLRFPGRADSAEGLWSVLSAAESQWSAFPEDRLNIQGFYHPSRNRQGSIPFRGAHLLRNDVSKFDAPFFAMTADEANAVDPQQRMLLEVSYEALENAGIRKEDVDGSQTSVFVGSFVKDYEQVCLRDPDDSPQYAATGNGIALMANRISYCFNLHGPSETVDTGCSGSLVSIHNAVQSLRSKESSLAIAAGAGLILTPATMMPMTALNFLSPDGKCFTFDARANGYGRGEGIGVVVLKRLSDAVRDNDTIRAVIRGSSTNQDGKTLGITLPSSEAQARNIRHAYETAGLGYEQTAFVECHGTGTQAGDWRELKAISDTISKGRSGDQPVVVGSLKPNIGHLEGAAGVAGMIKGVMVLERGQIPPQANYETPNPDIDFQGWKVKIPTSTLEWPISGIRRVSVNCFGFGGSNVHLIMDDAATYLQSRGLKGQHQTSTNSTPTQSTTTKEGTERFSRSRLYCFSGQDKAALKRVLKLHCDYLNNVSQGPLGTSFLQDYAYTLACRRTRFEWRTSIGAKSASDLAARIESLDESSFMRASKAQRRVCFVFGGQGAQWARMGHDLREFDVFGASLDEAGRYMMEKLQSPFDLRHEMSLDRDASRISQPEIAQPATTAVQIALVDLLRKLRITPSHIIGHSSGEIAAAYASGSISKKAAWTIAYWRGFYAAKLRALAPELEGTMMAVGMAPHKAQIFLTARGSPLQIACVNSPTSITLSGRRTYIQALSVDLLQHGIFHRILPVNIAYHSDFMKLISEHYKFTLHGIFAKDSPTGTRMFSTVTGREISGTELDNSYWARNMVSQVQYAAALEAMVTAAPENSPDLIVEISPRSQLQTPTTDTIMALKLPRNIPYLSIAGSRPLDLDSFYDFTGTLWAQGVPVDMFGVVKRTEKDPMPKSLVDLPVYPWDHTKSYWYESHLSSSIRFRPHGREDLIGVLTADSTPYEPKWRGFLRVFETPWLQDHKIQKTIIYPAAGMVTMALEAAKQITEGDPRVVGYEIKDLQIEKAIIVPESKHGIEIALNMRRSTLSLDQPQDAHGHFAIYTKGVDAPWQRHATGRLRICTDKSDWAYTHEARVKEYGEADASCKTQVAPRQLYELLDNIGMNYGPTFRNIKEIRKGEDRCVSRIKVPDTRSKMPEKFEFPHLIHPATLDSMIHSLFAIDSSPMVPVAIRSIYVTANINEPGALDFLGVSKASRQGLLRASADITMLSQQTRDAYILVNGLELANLTTDRSESSSFVSNNRHLATEIVWKEDVGFANPNNLRELLDLLSHKTPTLSVLQLGDDERTMRAALDVIAPSQRQTPSLARYTVAAVNAAKGAERCMAVVKGTRLEPFVESVALSDIAAEGAFNLILTAVNDGHSLAQLESHLNEGGLLLRHDKVSAAVDGAGGPTTNLNIHRRLGSSGVDARLSVAIIIPSHESSEISQLVTSMKSIVTKSFQGMTLLVTTLENFVEEGCAESPTVVLSLLDIEGEQSSFVYSWNEQTFGHFHKLQSIAKKMLWITRGSHRKPTNPRGSPLIGLIRTLISEDPLKRYATLDLGSRTSLSEESTATSILSVLRATFSSKTPASNSDAEYAEEDGRIYVPRLVPVATLNDLIEPDDTRQQFAEDHFSAISNSWSANKGIRHVPGTAGALAGSSFVGFELTDLALDEVEVEFRSATLTAQDVDTVSGRNSRHAFGLDVTGCVRRVGSNVRQGLKAGEEVAGLTFEGSLKSVLHIDHRLASSVPSGFVPSLYMSAYYALVHVARARKGAWVFIHGAASAHGIAAIVLAKRLELEVFMSVLGPGQEDQISLLESLGVLPDRIFAGDSLGFVPKLYEAAGGSLLDVAYNTTPEHVEACIRCVRSNGCVVQLAGPSLTQLPQLPVGGMTYTSFDTYSLLHDNMDLASELFEKTLHLFDSKEGSLPLPSIHTTSWTISAVDDAISQVFKTPYNGCAEVLCDPDQNDIVNIIKETPVKPLHEAIDTGGTYLIVGGFFGLGRSIADLLIKNGAQHLAFVSRSGVSSEASQVAISQLRSRGLDVRAFPADICDAHALQRVIDEIKSDMPPIRGVFQCAAVIQDAVFDNMTFADWQTAIRPKTIGSWNLVESMSNAGMDPFYIFLASSAGVIGNRGQANYAAGNSFEDAMAQTLSLQGKHAVSIDLGPVLGAGMLAEDEEVLDMLRASGFHSISHDNFLKVVSHAITGEIVAGQPMPPQVTLGVGTGGVIRQNKPADPYWTRTALYSYLNLVDMPPPDLSVRGQSATMGLRAMLARAPTIAAAGEIIAMGIREMLAKAMTMLPEEIDMDKAPNAYGVDSLVAIGLRNWVQGNCDVEVSLFEVLSDQTVTEMGTMIAKRGCYGGGTDDG